MIAASGVSHIIFFKVLVVLDREGLISFAVRATSPDPAFTIKRLNTPRLLLLYVR